MQATAPRRTLDLVLQEELAGGTFARVYRAALQLPGAPSRPVAVKILKEQWGDAEEIAARTRDEARLLSRLRHPNLVRVDDAFEVDGRLALVMELVDGADLRQLVEALAREGRVVPPRAALGIAWAVARALGDAQGLVLPGDSGPLRLVHRDIKPPNVMVDRSGTVKVLDFGTARTDDVGRWAQTTNVRFGSLKYMSPERREGERGELPSDVYALGVVLVEVLRGSWLPALPLDPVEHDEAVAAHVAALGDLGMPDQAWDDALRQLLGAMLRADPAARMPMDRAADLMERFTGQARGEILAEWARREVPAVADALASELQPGEWTGRRLTVAVENLTAAPISATPGRSPEEERLEGPAPLEPAEGDWGIPAWILAVGAGLLTGGFAAVVVAVWWWGRSAPPPPPPPRPLPEALAEALAAEAVPVRVRVEAPRAGMTRLEGAVALEGRAGLAGAVPPGDYTLSVELGGRTVAGVVGVPAAGLSLTCVTAGRGLSCGGADLKPAAGPAP